MGPTSSEHGASHAIREAGSRIFGSPVHAFILIFFISFGIRVALFASWMSTHEDFHRLGGEMGRVALSLTAMRFVHFWCGPLRLPWLAAFTTVITALALLGLGRVLPSLDAPGRAGLIIPLATFPLVYYVMSYVEHYRAPLAWMLLLLASYEMQGWMTRRNRTRADPAEQPEQ